MVAMTIRFSPDRCDDCLGSEGERGAPGGQVQENDVPEELGPSRVEGVASQAHKGGGGRAKDETRRLKDGTHGVAATRGEWSGVSIDPAIRSMPVCSSSSFRS